MRSAVGAGQDGGDRGTSAGDAGAGPLQVGAIAAGPLSLGDLKGRGQVRTQTGNQAGVLKFPAPGVDHVEGVHRPLAVAVNVGRDNGQAGIGDDLGQGCVRTVPPARQLT